MVKIGDLVRYGQAGVCRIDEMRMMKMASQEKEYYVLTPLFKSSSVLYVPCDNADLILKMKPLLSEGEIVPILKEAKKEKSEWIRDFRRRSELSKKALASSDPMALLLLIRSIYDHRREDGDKRVHTTDDYFLRDAEELLYSEIAFVTGKERKEVEEMIKKELGIEE